MKKKSIVGGAGFVLILLSGCGSDDGLLHSPSSSDHNKRVPQVVEPVPQGGSLPSVGVPPYGPPPYPLPPVIGPPPIPGQLGKPLPAQFGKPIGKVPLPIPLPIPVPPPLPLPLPVPPPYDIGKPPIFPGGAVPPYGGPGFGGPYLAGNPVSANAPASGGPAVDGARILSGRYNLIKARCSNRRTVPLSMDVTYVFDNATSGSVHVQEGIQRFKQIPMRLNYTDTDEIAVEPNAPSHSELQERKFMNRFGFQGTPILDGDSLKIQGEFSSDLFNCGTEENPEPIVELELHSLGERNSQ